MDTLKRVQGTSAGNKQLELMGYDYYNGETRFIEQYFMPSLKSLWVRDGNPKNIILIAHVMTKESAPDIKTKIVTITRQIVTAGRAVAAYIPTQFDDVWHFAYENDFETGTRKRVILTDGIGDDYAKTSFRIPNNKIEFQGKPPLFEGGDLYKKFVKIQKGDISAL
jgi:hypothetical protein